MAQNDRKKDQLSLQDRHAIAEVLADFERSWDDGLLAARLPELPPANPSLRRATLLELIKHDLERHWQQGQRIALEDYLQRYPELGSADALPTELILAEYLAQARHGADPSLAAFAHRFPAQAAELRRLVDEEEEVVGRESGSHSSVWTPPPPDSVHGRDQEPEREPALPEQFGRYHILKRLGRGGMGTVYLAHDTRLDRHVALKVPRFASSQPENLERFYREARATATITHPNLCPLFDVGEIDGQPYLTMTYIEGWSLARHIKSGKLLSHERIANLVRKVARAVAEAHKLGIIHRDLKPSNIMINVRGEPIVTDFGLARWVRADKEDVRLTRSGSILGAPVYMSPEQVYGDLDAMGPGCDIYSLGVVLYELLTGRLPFEGTDTAVLAQTLMQAPKPPSAHRPGIDPRLEAICLKAMAKQVKDRFESMDEFAAALTDYLRAGKQARTSPAASTAITTAPSPYRGPAIASPGMGSPREEPATPPSAPPVAATPSQPQKPVGRRGPIGVLVSLGLAVAVVAGVALGVNWFLHQPPAGAESEGTIRIELSPAAAGVTVQIDGQVFDGVALQQALQLPVGTHELVVTGPEFEELRQTFTVTPGDNAPLRVPLQAVAQRPPEPDEPTEPEPPPEPAAPPQPPGSLFRGHTAAVHSVAVSSDGQRVLSGGADATVRLWELADRRLLQTFTGHTLPVAGVALSPDGRRALSASADQTVRLWNVETGQQFVVFAGHVGGVRSVAFAPDGRQALSGGEDRTVRLWDVEAGTVVRVLTGHRGAVSWVAFSPDGQRALTASADRSIRLWDLASGKELRRLLGHTAGVRSVVFSASGKRALSGSDDQTVRLWDVDTGLQLKAFAGHRGSVNGVALTPDEKLALSVASGSDPTVRAWVIADERAPRLLGRHPSGGHCLAIAPNGTFILTGGEDSTIHVWDPMKDSTESYPWTAQEERTVELRRFGFPGHIVLRVAVMPDGRRALSAGKDRTVRVWDLATGQLLRTLSGHTGPVHALAVSPDGRHALSGSDDNTLRLWDVDTGQVVQRFEGHTDSVRVVAFSPDARLVLSGSLDRTARIWDVAGGKEVRRFEKHKASVRDGALTPDGRRALTVGTDGAAREWEVATGKELRTFTVTVKRSIATYLADGRRVVVTGSHRTLRIRESERGRDSHPLPGPPVTVVSLATSPGGRLLAAACLDRSVRVWDVHGNQLLCRFTAGSDPAGGAVFTPDGCFVLSAGADGMLRLWELPRFACDPPPLPAERETAAQRKRLDGHARSIWSVAWSADRRRALSASLDGTLRWWEIESGKTLQTCQDPSPARGSAILPDGRRALSGHADKVLRLWDLESGKLVRALSGSTGAVTQVAVSADGRLALSGSEDGGLFLWDLESGQLRRSLPGHAGAVWSVAFTPEGKQATSGSADGTVRLWEVEGGEEVMRFRVPRQVNAVAVSPDGRRVLCGGTDMLLYLWEVATGRLLGSFQGHTAGVSGVAFSPDGRWVLSASQDRSVRLWDIETGRETSRFQGHADAVLAVAFAPDGRSALSGGTDNRLLLWDLPEQTAVVPVGPIRSWTKQGKTNTRVAVSPDGRLALSPAADNTVRLWDANTGRELRKLTGHSALVRALTFAPDGKTALSGDAEKGLILWDLDSGQEVRHFQGHQGAVMAVVFSADGGRILSGSEDQTARLWDTATGSELRCFTGHQGRVATTAFAPDGRKVLTGGSDRIIRLWDAETGKELRQLKGPLGSVTGVGFSPDGRQAISSGSDGMVRLWDLDSSQLVHTFRGHEGAVNSVALSPDGRRILSAGVDNTVRLWDVATRQPVHVFVGHHAAVSCVVCCPDGRRFLSCSRDKTVRLWGLPPR